MLVVCAVVLAGCDSAEERVKSHYERGLALVEQGEHLKGSLEFRNALSLNDKHVPALFALAKAEQNLGNLHNAAGIFIRVVEAAPEHVDARIALANILLLAGQLDEALKYANQAYGLAPDEVSVLVVKAALALKLGNTEEAIMHSEKALRLSPDNVDALMVRAAERFNAEDPKGALEFLDRGEEENSSNVGLQLFRMQALAALEDREGIEAVLKKLVAAYPENAQFRFGLARWYHGANQRGDAEAVLRKYAADVPNEAQAGLALVAYLAQTNGFDAAKAELMQRIERGIEAFTYRIALAELTFGNGDYDAAYAILQRVIGEKGKAPDANRARVLLARMKLNRSAPDEAKPLLETVLGEDEKNADALTLLSSVLISDKAYTKAIESLLVALNEEPDSTRILLLLSQAYELDGSTELAEEQLAKAARLARFSPNVALPYVQFLLRYGKAEQAERVLLESRTAAPANRQVLGQLAQLRLSRQDWLGAQEVAEAIRQLDDTNETANRIKALALAGQEKYEESNALLHGALSDSTNDAAPVARYVENLVRSGQRDKALDFVNGVLADNPGNVRVRLLLGALHESDGESELAEASYKMAVQNDDAGVAAVQALARFYVRVGKDGLAEDALRSALDRRDDSTSLRLLLAAVLEQSGRYEEAVAEYEILYNSLPQSTIIANNLASLLADYGESEEQLARAHAIALRFRGSEIPQFLDTLGWVHYRRGEYEQAVALIKTASEQLGNIDLVQYHLGMVYKALGETKLAIEALKQAISLAEGKQFAQLESAKLALKELSSTQ